MSPGFDAAGREPVARPGGATLGKVARRRGPFFEERRTRADGLDLAGRPVMRWRSGILGLRLFGVAADRFILVVDQRSR